MREVPTGLFAAKTPPDFALNILLQGRPEIVDDGSIDAAVHKAKRVSRADKAVKLADQRLESSIVDANTIYTGKRSLPLVTKLWIRINQKHFHLVVFQGERFCTHLHRLFQ